MMTGAKRFAGEGRIWFPWERRGGLRSLLMLGRVGPVLVVFGVLGFIAILGVRERQSAGIRQTRATLIEVRRAVDAYRADNDGGCPASLDKLSDYGNFKETPSDAWGHALRFTCPSHREGEAYQLSSDGPDGEPGGLDRVE
ncbi:MAG TPA: type II secretion system protein GspG [Polyangiaceae bacterium]|jgi:general secretion pathway protein G|nr:type II secretion system protein GspG [Polyangiaceae bacterium]